MTQNAINNNSTDFTTTNITIDPGSSGDSYVQFDINATGEFRAGVDDTDDSYRISQGSALGTNDTFIMTAAGERTMPLQSAFLAGHTVAQDNVTGDSTDVTVNFTTEVFDQNSDYDGTNTFTAPVTGRYYLNTGIRFAGLTTSHTGGVMRIITSNTTYQCNSFNYGAVKNASSETIFGYGIFCDMDALDTASVQVQISGSTKVVDIPLTGGVGSIWFGGYLVC